MIFAQFYINIDRLIVNLWLILTVNPVVNPMIVILIWKPNYLSVFVYVAIAHYMIRLQFDQNM